MKKISQTSRDKRRTRLPRSSRAGFTLVEMLIVFALIATIGGLAIGALGGMFGQAEEDAAKQFVNNSLEAPLLQFKIHMGSYPTTEQGIPALLAAPSDRASRWRGPYIRKMPEDPWGNPYQYRFPGTHNPGSYDLWSNGPDGVESSDDIGNWE